MPLRTTFGLFRGWESSNGLWRHGLRRPLHACSSHLILATTSLSSNRFCTLGENELLCLDVAQSRIGDINFKHSNSFHCPGKHSGPYITAGTSQSVGPSSHTIQYIQLSVLTSQRSPSMEPVLQISDCAQQPQTSSKMINKADLFE